MCIRDSAEIDPRDFHIRKERAEAIYCQAKAEFERIEKLYEKNNVSDGDVWHHKEEGWGDTILVQPLLDVGLSLIHIYKKLSLGVSVINIFNEGFSTKSVQGNQDYHMNIKQDWA